MLTLDQQASWRDAISQIKRAVPMRQALHMVGWPVRGKRAKCGLKEHSDRQAVAFNDGLWKCFACNVGGDQITLIELAHGCSRGDAIKLLAEEARVELPNAKRLTKEERRRWAREREEREQREGQLDTACAAAEEWERRTRIRCAQYIRRCDQVLHVPAPWDEQQWQRARAAHLLRDEWLLPGYALLGFAVVEQRVGYMLANDDERLAMLATVRWADGVVGDDGHFVEIGRLT